MVNCTSCITYHKFMFCFCYVLFYVSTFKSGNSVMLQFQSVQAGVALRLQLLTVFVSLKNSSRDTNEKI